MRRIMVPMPEKIEHLVWKRLRELLRLGEEYARQLVSERKVPGEETPIGGPPKLRTGRLYRGITSRVWRMPDGRIVGKLESTATAEDGTGYPYVLEAPEGFDAFGEVHLGPYPWMRPTFEFLQSIAPRILGKRHTSAEWGYIMGHPSQPKIYRKITI